MRLLSKQFGKLTRMVPGLIASASVVALMQIQAWEPIEYMVHNQVVRWRGPTRWDSRLVMINIDDKTLDALGQFPISRSYYAQLIKQLRKEDASVIAFNLILADSTPAAYDQPQAIDTTTSRLSATALMAEEMALHGRVVIGQAWSPEGTAVEPMRSLSAAAIATGHIRLPVDLDGFTRTAELIYKELPALGVAAIQAYSLDQALVSIPTDTSQIQINWPASVTELSSFSLIDVINGDTPPDIFKDKIVIVSYGATSGLAPMRTPFDNRWPVPGGYLHAAVVDNLLNQNWLRALPQPSVALALLIVGPGLSWLLYKRRPWLQLAVTSGSAVSWLLMCIAALHVGYMLPVVPPIVMIVSTGIGLFVWGRLRSNALLQVRSAFLSTMSHEIRTPLNAIINLSEMLQDTALTDHQREYVETLCSSSQTLMALINDVLDFSKIESGRLTLEGYPISVTETIERSMELLAPRAAEKAIELVYVIDASAPSVIVSDPVRLQQILINLLSNAVKFTERGQVCVRVSARPIEPKKNLLGLPSRLKKEALATTVQPPLAESSDETSLDLCELCFEVRDTGIGIPANRMAKLFEPFSQVSTSTTRKYGGTGLGLSISKRLTERMGGDLWVKSTVGQGSTFYFTFQSKAAQLSTALPSYLSVLQGAYLLLIDRNKTRCEQMKRELQRLDVSCVRVSSMAEAAMFIRNAPAFDGVVLDGAIADSFGSVSAAVETLRTAAENEHLPVIFLSLLNRNIQALPPEVTMLWKPIKQASFYQALRSVKPFTLATAPDVSPPLSETGSLNSPSSPSSSNSPNGPISPGSPNSPSSSNSPGSSNRYSALRILLAEDNRTNQKVALRLLELLGYKADLANSGSEVLAALLRQRYDVILMDMRMPNMDGVEATRQIRKLPMHANTWIIAMTANSMARDRKLCFSVSMNDYLRKPIKREALAQALRRVPINGLDQEDLEGPNQRLPG